MILFLLFYILVIPLCVLFHEIGHGIGVLSTSKSRAHVYLGLRSKENRENFKIGKLHFHINWSYVGFVDWDVNLSNRQRVFALAGGPVMSLFLALSFGVFTFLLPHGDLRTFLFGIAIFNLIQFLATIIPVTYPRWMGPYNGHPSDGLLLLRILKGRKVN